MPPKKSAASKPRKPAKKQRPASRKRSAANPAKKAAPKKRAAKKTAAKKTAAKKASPKKRAAKKTKAGPTSGPPRGALSSVPDLPADEQESEVVVPIHPEGLGPDGLKLWKQVLADYELAAHELCILADACLERDLIDRMRRDLIGQPSSVKGSMGQMVANPLISELRQHRMTFAALVGKLKLPSEEAGGHDASALGRALVNQRWRK